MPITSLIVRTTADNIQTVAEKIRRLPGASVSDIKDDSLVVITDTEDRQADKALWDQMEQISGVAAVDVIYHNFEDLED